MEIGTVETRSQRPLTPRSLLWASGWLAIFLIAGKAASGGIVWWPQPAGGVASLAAASWSDALFALACGVAGALALRLLARWPRGAKALRIGLLVLFTILALYAFVAAGIFQYFHRPLTLDLLGLIGNANAVRSSIAERITWPIAGAFIGAPILFWFLASRIPRPRFLAALLSLVAIWLVAGWTLERRGWESEKLAHLRLSPHAEILRSGLARISGSQRPGFPKDFPPSYWDEFRTVGGREQTAPARFPLPVGVARPKNVIVLVLESVGHKLPRALRPSDRLHAHPHGRGATCAGLRANLRARQFHLRVLSAFALLGLSRVAVALCACSKMAGRPRQPWPV